MRDIEWLAIACSGCHKSSLLLDKLLTSALAKLWRAMLASWAGSLKGLVAWLVCPYY